jgi:hypothetical protein
MKHADASMFIFTRFELEPNLSNFKLIIVMA